MVDFFGFDAGSLEARKLCPKIMLFSIFLFSFMFMICFSLFISCYFYVHSDDDDDDDHVNVIACVHVYIMHFNWGTDYGSQEVFSLPNPYKTDLYPCKDYRYLYIFMIAYPH